MKSLTCALLTELLREAGHATIEVGGNSMLPAIRPGDVLSVETGPAAIGDVVVFNQAGHLCAHRLLAVVDSQAITRGDANQRLDLPFACKEILGRVTSLERNGKTIRDLTYRPLRSLLIRNSSLIRRLYLHVQSAWKILPGIGISAGSPRSTKLQA